MKHLKRYINIISTLYTFDGLYINQYENENKEIEDKILFIVHNLIIFSFILIDLRELHKENEDECEGPPTLTEKTLNEKEKREYSRKFEQ